MTVRVGVNLLWMVHGEVGGSESYTLTHLRALAAHGPDDVEPILFVLPGFGERHPDLAGQFELVEAPVSGSSRPARVAVEATWLARHARGAGVEVLHHPGGTLPVRSGLPAVLTIHDLQWVTFPRYFSRTKLAYLKARVGPSIRRAAVVLVNSQYVRRTVVDYAGVDGHDVKVVPAAVGALPDVAADLDEVCRRHDLERPFFLYPAITYPHKNHLVLVWALAGLTDHQVQLVLTGGVASMEATIEAEVSRLGLRDRVRRLGRIPQDELEALYGGATAVLFPSTYEGFGMGVVEAMRRGCPVAAADTTALPEVVGDDGLLLAPGDPGAWAEAMARLLDEPDLREDLGRRGRARVEAFDAREVAETLAAAYRQAAGIR